MTNVSLTYESINTEASALDAGRQTIMDELNRLKSRIQGLVTNGFVTTSSSNAYHQAYQQFNGGATQTIDALTQLASMLRTIANTFKDTDEGLARQIGNH